MRSTLRVLARTTGSIVGLFIGGVSVFLVFSFIVAAVAGPVYLSDMTTGSLLVVFFGPPAALVGAIMGAAGGATITQEFLKQRSSFWKALLGAVVGTVVPVIGTVVGAVIGSSWGAKPASSSAMILPQQGVISPGDILKPPPGQSKCPFCRSTTFRVGDEADSRRCSDCHSVLPNYLQGNR